QFVAVDVHEQPVPERLHEMEDEPFLAVQEPKPEYVAVNEVPERTCIQRQAIPDSLQPPRALVGRAKRARWALVGVGAPSGFFACLLNGIAIVLGDPDGDVALVPVVFTQLPRKNHRRTGHMKVVIARVILIEDDWVLAKQLEGVFGIVPAVTDPAAAEVLPPIQVSTRRRTFSCPLGDSFEN